MSVQSVKAAYAENVRNDLAKIDGLSDNVRQQIESILYYHRDASVDLGSMKRRAAGEGHELVGGSRQVTTQGQYDSLAGMTEDTRYRQGDHRAVDQAMGLSTSGDFAIGHELKPGVSGPDVKRKIAQAIPTEGDPLNHRRPSQESGEKLAWNTGLPVPAKTEGEDAAAEQLASDQDRTGLAQTGDEQENVEGEQGAQQEGQQGAREGETPEEGHAQRIARTPPGGGDKDEDKDKGKFEVTDKSKKSIDIGTSSKK